jgi:hypothetical protein
MSNTMAGSAITEKDAAMAAANRPKRAFVWNFMSSLSKVNGKKGWL